MSYSLLLLAPMAFARAVRDPSWLVSVFPQGRRTSSTIDSQIDMQTGQRPAGKSGEPSDSSVPSRRAALTGLRAALAANCRGAGRRCPRASTDTRPLCRSPLSLPKSTARATKQERKTSDYTSGKSGQSGAGRADHHEVSAWLTCRFAQLEPDTQSQCYDWQLAALFREALEALQGERAASPANRWLADGPGWLVQKHILHFAPRPRQVYDHKSLDGRKKREEAREGSKHIT